ncbi:WD domain, G-beta repeat [Carpediemonas membranifera]|uniref:WD domain, G-beta repeat n=1 Tax=Carpediemonas membranifera TaxID=201153 RepID=A0A8J6B243_9EUKA|nr:WD domain, G-beta repeat [Carpediemonas membranifera]|eukprot:KAG9397625.1 WD domain, G-beta repeat [Carpediemonas membranifera]
MDILMTKDLASAKEKLRTTIRYLEHDSRVKISSQKTDAQVQADAEYLGKIQDRLLALPNAIDTVLNGVLASVAEIRDHFASSLAPVVDQYETVEDYVRRAMGLDDEDDDPNDAMQTAGQLLATVTCVEDDAKALAAMPMDHTSFDKFREFSDSSRAVTEHVSAFCNSVKPPLKYKSPLAEMKRIIAQLESLEQVGTMLDAASITVSDVAAKVASSNTPSAKRHKPTRGRNEMAALNQIVKNARSNSRVPEREPAIIRTIRAAKQSAELAERELKSYRQQISAGCPECRQWEAKVVALRQQLYSRVKHVPIGQRMSPAPLASASPARTRAQSATPTRAHAAGRRDATPVLFSPNASVPLSAIRRWDSKDRVDAAEYDDEEEGAVPRPHSVALPAIGSGHGLGDDGPESEKPAKTVETGEAALQTDAPDLADEGTQTLAAAEPEEDAPVYSFEPQIVYHLPTITEAEEDIASSELSTDRSDASTDSVASIRTLEVEDGSDALTASPRSGNATVAATPNHPLMTTVMLDSETDDMTQSQDDFIDSEDNDRTSAPNVPLLDDTADEDDEVAAEGSEGGEATPIGARASFSDDFTVDSAESDGYEQDPEPRSRSCTPRTSADEVSEVRLLSARSGERLRGETEEHEGGDEHVDEEKKEEDEHKEEEEEEAGTDDQGEGSVPAHVGISRPDSASSVDEIMGDEDGPSRIRSVVSASSIDEIVSDGEHGPSKIRSMDSASSVEEIVSDSQRPSRISRPESASSVDELSTPNSTREDGPAAIARPESASSIDEILEPDHPAKIARPDSASSVEEIIGEDDPARICRPESASSVETLESAFVDVDEADLDQPRVDDEAELHAMHRNISKSLDPHTLSHSPLPPRPRQSSMPYDSDLVASSDDLVMSDDNNTGESAPQLPPHDDITYNSATSLVNTRGNTTGSDTPLVASNKHLPPYESSDTLDEQTPRPAEEDLGNFMLTRLCDSAVPGVIRTLCLCPPRRPIMAAAEQLSSRKPLKKQPAKQQDIEALANPFENLLEHAPHRALSVYSAMSSVTPETLASSNARELDGVDEEDESTELTVDEDITGSAGSLSVQDAESTATVIAGSTDGKVTIWEIFDGRIESSTVMAGHSEGVNQVVAEPGTDTRPPLAASCSDDRTIVIWDLDRAVIRRRLRAAAPALCCAFAHIPDNGEKVLSVAVGSYKLVNIFNIETGQAIHALHHGDGLNVYTLACHPTLPIIASGGDDKRVRLWSSNDGKLVTSLAPHKSWVMRGVFTHDGLLCTTDQAGYLRMSDSNGNILGSTRGHNGAATAVLEVSLEHVLTVGTDGQAVIYGRQGTVDKFTTGHLSSVYDAAFDQEKGILVTAGSDRTLRVMMVRAKECL